MENVNLRKYIAILDEIKSTDGKIRALEAWPQLPCQNSGNHGGETPCFVTDSRENDLLHQRSYLTDLQTRKALLEASNDFSGIEEKYNAALQVESAIKRETKTAWGEMMRVWMALSHPALDPVLWIQHWIKEAADAYGVNADENTKINVQYRFQDAPSIRPPIPGAIRIFSKAFTLRDIVTNRYWHDENIKMALSGSVQIQWGNVYPQGFIDRVGSGTVAHDHEASLTRHLEIPGTVDCLVDHFRNEMLMAAHSYLAAPNRNGRYDVLVQDFIAGKRMAQPVYANGEVLDRLILIPAEANGSADSGGVLLSLIDKRHCFLELPFQEQMRTTLIESKQDWLRQHVELSKRQTIMFTRVIRPNLGTFGTPANIASQTVSALSTNPGLVWSSETRRTERILVDNHLATVRANMDFMTTTNAELWVDWLVHVGNIAGLVVSLALAPAAIAGAPYMLGAALLTTTVTAVLPNIAKIVVNKNAEQRKAAVTNIVVAITLDALGYGISKVLGGTGAKFASHSNFQSASQSVQAAAGDLRAAVEQAIRLKSLELVQTSIKSNRQLASSYIDSLDIAKQMTYRSVEQSIPWHDFGTQFTGPQFDAFMLKWGNSSAIEAGKISTSPNTIVRTVDTLTGTGAQIAAELVLD